MKEKESVTYRHMLEKVESIITQVSSSDVDLDEMVTKVEEGYQVIRKMRERLLETKGKIEKLRSEFEEAELPKEEQ